MKLIITSRGPDPTDIVDPCFGRAQWFIIHDDENGEFTPLDNAAQVQIYSGIAGTVEEALQTWRRGDLELLTGPDGSPQH
ncbi:hypothetical protein DRQ50_03020 [bacterium]|nr:MAG: hypothetical protein DRQ50_03020 [bacterium]